MRLVEVSEPARGMIPTGREAQYVITYVLTGGQFGIEPGYVVLGLGPVAQPGEDGNHA